MKRLPITGIFLLFLLCCTGAAAQGQSVPAATDADNRAQEFEIATQDIEKLIATLEDPQARERLIGDLRLLLEAHRKAETGEGTTLNDVTASAVLEGFRQETRALVEQVGQVNPIWVLRNVALSVVVVVVIVLLYMLSLRVLRISFAFIGRSRQVDENADKRRARQERAIPDFFCSGLKFVYAAAAVFFIIDLWGGNVIHWITAGAGSGFGRAFISILFVVLLALSAWHFVDSLIDRIIEGHVDDVEGRSGARLRSLVPMVRGVVGIAIALVAGLLVLSELGVNIAPLLAGAGIVGLAVGFGAQSLVKDFLVGISLLVEDAANVGDVVEVAGSAGLVERMDYRVMRLRNLEGAMFTIPYSEITVVKNFTREYSYYLFDIGVAYREDVDEVIGVLKEVAEDLRQDPDFGSNITEAVEILGLDRFADSAVVIRGRLKTKPRQQWSVGREFNRRVKMKFDELDIEIPFPHTTLYFGQDKGGGSPPGRLKMVGREESGEGDQG